MFVLLSANLLFGQTATAPSGAGTSVSPYQISSLNNLYWISQNSLAWGAYYQQTTDIDASSTSTWNSNGSGGYYGWTPIGNNTTPFTGHYDGQGIPLQGYTQIKKHHYLW